MRGSRIDGGVRTDGPAIPVLDKYRLTEPTTLRAAMPRVVDDALAAAASYASAPLPPPERAVALRRAADLLEERRGALLAAMTVEAGFPGRDAEGEVAGAVATLRLPAEEATRLAGEMVPFDGAVAGRLGFTIRVSVGVVVAITPFDAPCHEVGPALAAGNAVIPKPSEKTPTTADLLVGTLLDAGFPPGAVQSAQGGPDVARALVDDPRPAFYAFTGSTAAGAAIQAAAGLRRTQTELGSIASTIVLDGDLPAIAAECAGASFRKAGRVCTSIRTLYAAREAHDASAKARALIAGDAVARVNAAPDGLAAGVFTRDISAAFAAARTLNVGGVHIDETSSSRVDLMPYGGVKMSGFGREGPRYEAREMSHERLVTVSGL